MPIKIDVTKIGGKIVNEHDEPEKRMAEYDFSAVLRNVGEKTLYDAAVTINCNRKIQVKDTDRDLVIERTDANAVTFRPIRMMHPNDKERRISWTATAKPFPYINGIDATRIVVTFRVCARDRQPEELAVEFDGDEPSSTTKEATRQT